MLTAVYYSSLSALNYRVSSMVKPTLLASSFAKPSPSVVPYEPVDELKGLSNEWFIRHNTW